MTLRAKGPWHERRRGCYLLHSRPYRETSLLVRFFHHEDGVIAAVARGAMAARSLQPFFPFSARVTGRSDLKSLIAPEEDGVPWLLSPQAAFSALYANELILASCAEQDGHPQLYQAYVQLLARLSREKGAVARQVALRRFEHALFSDVGYEINYRFDTHDRHIVATTCYNLGEEWVFVPDANGRYTGDCLLAIAADDYAAARTLETAKRLSRDILQRMLGKSLNSWKLFA